LRAGENVRLHEDTFEFELESQFHYVQLGRTTFAASLRSIQECKFLFDFERVLWLACLENKVIEFQRA
jgi:hypothetical protein